MAKTAVTTDDVNAFINSCILLRRAYIYYHDFFEPSNPHGDVFCKIAPLFFGDFNRILVMYIILEACKLADPARDVRNNVNLSVEFFVNHTDFSNDPGEFDKLNNRAAKIREFGQKLKPARDKIISHLDRPTASSSIKEGAADTYEWNEFWLDLELFVQILCHHYFSTIRHNLILGANSDAGSIVKTLRRADRQSSPAEYMDEDWGSLGCGT